MIMKQKFTVVRILSLKQNISEVLSVMLENGFIVGTAESAGASDLSFKRIDGENPFEKPIAQLTSVAKYAGWNIPESIEKEELTENFSDYIDKIYKQYQLFKKEKQMLLEQRESCIEGKNRIKLFGKLPVDLQSLNECEFLKIRFGHIPKNCLLKLREVYYKDPVVEFFESYESETDVWGIYLVPINDAGRIDSIFASLLFEPVNIPSASGNAKEIEEQIDMSIEIIENQLSELKSHEDEFFNSKFEKCKCLFNILIRENKKRKFLDNALENENSYIVSGSLPKDITDTVCEKLKSIDGAFITKLDTIKLKVS